MDAERLKHGGNLTDEFFERQLEKIREIRWIDAVSGLAGSLGVRRRSLDILLPQIL